MLKKMFVLYLMLSCYLLIFSNKDNTIIKKENLKKISITNGVQIKNTGLSLTKLVIIMPLPESNIYQNIIKLDNNRGEILKYKNSNGRYIRFTLYGNDLLDEKLNIYYSFDAEIFNITTDFSNIKDFGKYNDLDQFIIENGEEIVFHPEINKIYKSISSKSSNQLDYVMNCYEYVSKNFLYLNANTGIHPLKTIIQNNGGDCGNLTSIFVSLLRKNKIPSKHLVAIRPDGQYHVWADFYLDNLGWIPVDVTFKNANNNGNYFGIININDNGIILSEDLNHMVEIENGNYHEADMMQTFYYWYWYNGGEGDLNISHYVKSE